VVEENTQYGLKNYLIAEEIESAESNHFQIKLKNKAKKAFLNIVFITKDTIRFHYSFNKKFNLNLPNQDLNFESENQSIYHQEFDERFEIQGEKLKVIIYKNPLKTAVFNRKGQLISSDYPGLGFWSGELNDCSQEIRIYKKYESLENPPIIYGLGDKTGSINRWGRRFRNSPIDALGYDSKETDPLYKDIPFFIHFDKESKRAHGIFFDNYYKKTFDFGKERKPGLYYYMSAQGGEANYYVFNGPSIKEVLQNYLKLTGMPALMPDYALGYLASGMSYLENYGAQEKQDDRLVNTLARFKDEKLEPSAFHMSSGYILNDQNERHQFIWNKEKFPNAKEFTRKIKELGIKLCANVKPVLLKTHPLYKEANKLNIFIEDTRGKTLIVDYWGGEGSYIDFRKASAQTWWLTKLEETIFDQGIDGVWNDNNEYEIFDNHKAQGSEPQMSLLMSKLSYELAKKLKPQEEPWILSRSGYSGIQKYVQTWIGDNYSSWESLKYDNAILCSLSLSGLVHCGTDIGGFYGPEVDPELFLRWIQCGVFSPRFSIHSYKEKATEPDMFKDSHPEFFKIIQNFFQIRKELLPYLKEQNEKAHKDGIPIMRPLVYDFPQDENIHEESFHYMLGDQYLVCPVFETKDNETTKDLYLPKKDSDWIHFFTKKKFKAGESHKIENNLEYIHIFVR
jgi:alpha-glucosidase